MSNVFATPDDVVAPAVDLWVVLNVQGAWDFDQTTGAGALAFRTKVLQVSQGMNGKGTAAKLSIDLSPWYYGDDQAIREPIGLGSLADILHPDTRLAIYAEIPAELPGGGPASRRFLFEGYPRSQPIVFAQDTLQTEFDCMSLLDRLATEAAGFIQGRWLVDVLPDGSDKVKHIPALPAIFNANGKPNRRADLVDGVNGLDNVPLFTWDGDPDAVYWRYADVLVYLLACYHAALGTEYPIKDGNGYHRAQDIVTTDGIADLPDEFVATPTLKDAMGRKSDVLTLEGMNLRDALAAWCAACGACMATPTFNKDLAGEPETRMLFWFAGDGGPFSALGGFGDLDTRTIILNGEETPLGAFDLLLAADNTTPTGPGALHDNEVSQGEIILDASSVLTKVTIAGAVDQYEVTIGKRSDSDLATSTHLRFKPLWKPDANFGDGLAGAPQTAKIRQVVLLSGVHSAEALAGAAETLFNQYVKAGENHADYRTVGRLWGLNESGEYLPADYARAAGVFGSGAYSTAYDWHSGTTVPLVNSTQSWCRRRRRFLAPISRHKSGIEPRLILWASWNGGIKWYEYPGNWKALHDQCAVLLTDPNLASVICPAPYTETGYGQSVWEGIVRDTFRLAITCTIEGDGRLSVTETTDAAYATQEHGTLLLVHEALKVQKQANSELIGAADYDFEEIDETSRAQELARRILATSQNRLVSGTLHTDWIRNDWWPGDLLSGIQPRGFTFSAGKGVRRPQVVAVTWTNEDGGQYTQITLDDDRTQIRETGTDSSIRVNGTKAAGKRFKPDQRNELAGG